MNDAHVTMKYDPQVDILRLRFGNTPIEESAEVQPGLIVDFDAEGQIVGLEIMDASEVVQRREMTSTTESK